MYGYSCGQREDRFVVYCCGLRGRFWDWIGVAVYIYVIQVVERERGAGDNRCRSSVFKRGFLDSDALG